MDPLNNPQPQNTPISPAPPQEPVSTPMPQQPLQSQGMPTGQMPGQMPGQELATPEQRQELLDMLDAVRGKMGELQTAKFRSANESEVARVETLKAIFVMMQESGVDLNDPASVAAFLDRMRSMNPTMAQQFEDTLEDLLSEEMPPEEQQMGMSAQPFGGAAAEQMPGNEMIGNEAVSQNLRGPVPPQGGSQIG